MIFKLRADIFSTIFGPICAPIIAPAAKIIPNKKSIEEMIKLVTLFTVAAKTIMNVEVATAKCIGKLHKIFNVGTLTNPPPIPNNPDNTPEKKAIGKTISKLKE